MELVGAPSATLGSTATAPVADWRRAGAVDDHPDVDLAREYLAGRATIEEVTAERDARRAADAEAFAA